MIKNNGISYNKKLNRYRWLIKLPFFIFLAIAALIEIPIFLLCILFVTSMVGDLVFYGILIGEKDYSYKALAIDTIVLYLVTIFSTTIIAPNLFLFFNKIDLLPNDNFLIYSLNVLLALLTIYVFWYLFLLIQKLFFNNNDNNWKWKASGILNSTIKLS